MPNRNLFPFLGNGEGDSPGELAVPRESPVEDYYETIDIKEHVVDVGFGVSVAKLIWNKLTPEQKRHIFNVAREKGSEVANNIVQGITKEFQKKFRNSGSNKKDNNNNMRKQKNGGGNGGSSNFMVSENPLPQPISIGSDVRPNFYTVDFMKPSDYCSPLHISQVSFSLPPATSAYLYDYFLKFIAFDIQTQAQANVSFNLNTSKVFTGNNIREAINAQIRALEIYYYYMSIINYHAEAGNKNSGMLHIHSFITPQMYVSLSRLARRLADTPCPPNLMKVIKYLNGNYYSGKHNGSTLLKIVPVSANTDGISILDDIDNAFDALNTDTINEVFALLRRAVPSWMPKTLTDIPKVPSYDEDFITIFANLPYIQMSADAKEAKFPSVGNPNDSVIYNVFSDKLDGVAFCMTSINTATDGWIPGLLSPKYSTKGLDTRRSYYVSKGSYGFFNVKDFPTLIRSRAETYSATDKVYDAAPVIAHLPGASLAKGVTPNVIAETTTNALDWIMSTDSIRSGSKMASNIKGR